MEEILIVDDDPDLCEMLREYLGHHGFLVHVVHRGDTGLEVLRSRSWAVVLLDVMLPGLDGFGVLRRFRTFSSGSVILLTARGEDVDRIVGLELGADDYLPKPFNARELLARIRAIGRRHAPSTMPEDAVALYVEDLYLNVASRSATKGGQPLDLTDVEFALLEVFMRSPGKVLEREKLTEQVLGRRFQPYDRSLDMHVSRLRRKLSDGVGEGRVKAVRGAGYQLVATYVSP